mgnify:CR=1 FL=1
MKKIRLLIILLLALMILNPGCSNSNKDTQPVDQMTGSGSSRAQDRESGYLSDARELISVVEKTHPAFALGDISDDYKQRKQELVNSVTKDTGKEEFTLLVRKYLASLHDGHTGVQNDSAKRFLNVNCRADGNDLFLLNDDGSLSADRITHIEGVPVNRIFETVQTYYVAENDAAKNMNNSIWALNDEMLKLAGCDISTGSAEITVERDGVCYKEEAEFADRDIYESYNYSYEIKSEIINDHIFYIDMNICEDNKNLKAQIKELRKAIKSGITKVIIDVRDNPGGNSTACTKLLNAMGMRNPEYGSFIRYSELAHEQRGVPSEGFRQYDPDKAKARRNDKIQLVVLTNERTYSSATMLAVFVQDGDLGTVIGTPSSNAPSSYGDILYYQLPSSGIEVTISYKRWLRPDTEADQRILIPDIVTDYNSDILQTAIDYLSN